MLNEFELTGRARSHITQLEAPRCALHHEVVQPFLAMREAAAQEGIDLEPFSSFRDFDAQLAIWNKKFSGERTLFDANGQPMDYSSLSPVQIVDAILMWSALPGASRHHWGSEIDVIDRAAVPPDYRIQLLPDEFAPGGVFHRLQQWLDQNLAQFDFFRPYDRDRGGVQPEPWHLSYAPVSVDAQAQLSIAVIEAAIADAPIMGKDLVLERLAQIHHTFVANVGAPARIV